MPQKSVAYIDVSSLQVQRTPMNVDAAIMNPQTKVMAVRQGKALQVSNLDMKTKVASFKMPDTADIVYWKWIDTKTIALVTNNAVFHWSMAGGNPKKMFDRREELAGGQIINYGVSKDGKMCFLQAIKKMGQGIGGVIQLFSVDKGGSQMLQGHAASFGTININGRKGEVFVCAERNPGANGMLRIKEIGGSFSLPPKEFVFPPNAAQDFPICLTIDEKHDLAFMVSKMGNVFMFDLLSGTTLFRKPLGTQPFAAVQNTSNGGMLCVNQGGAVTNISLNEKNLVPFVMNVLHNQDLAITIASRLGLPGADDIFKNQLEALFKAGNVRGIAELAARSPATTVRNQETINRLKSMKRGPDGASPPSVYFQTLLSMTKLNEIETVELAGPLVLNGKIPMIEKFLKEDKITPSEALGDLIAPHDARVALQVYFKGNAHEKVINCFLQLNDFGKIQAYIDKTGYEPDFGYLVSQMVRVNPEQAAEFAIKSWEKKPAAVDAGKVADAFANVGAIRECDKFLFKVLAGDKPEDGPLQTKLLELNLRAGISNVVDTIFSNHMFSHYDRVSIAHLCEQAGLAQRALEHYTDLDDIKRVIMSPRLMNAVNPEFMIQYFANMTKENRMECLKDMLSTNINSLQLVVKVAQKCPEEEAPDFIKIFEENDESFQGLYYYLGSILHKSEDPEVHLKYIKAAVKLNQIQEVERVCRESNVYNPEEVRDFLLSVHMPDPRPIIRVCDRFGYIEDMTSYLFQHKLMNFLEIYVTKVAGQNTPRVIGKLLDLDAPEDVIKNLLNLARGMCPAEGLVEEVEKRNKLKLILPWCESRAAEGNQDPSLHNALGKIYVTLNKEPQEFLLKNQFYDSAVVGKYCEKLDPYLAYLAYRRAWGPCDADLLRVTNENGLFKDQARYLVERQDMDLWAMALTDENEYKETLVDQVVGTALPECTNPEEVASTVKAFMANGLKTELIGLLERLVLQGSDFSNHESLQNLLIITAMDNSPEKVMEYISRLNNYDAPKIAERCVEYNLYEEALYIYKRDKDDVNSVKVLLDYIHSIERAYEYAERVNVPQIWSMVAAAQLAEGDIPAAIDSYIKAKDCSNYQEIIRAAEGADEYEPLIRYIKMTRETVTKDPAVDTSLVYAYAKTGKTTELEEFLASPNVAQIIQVGDRLFEEEIYEAARLVFAASGNNAKLASCYLKLLRFREALDAAKKANSIRTWKEVNQTCVYAAIKEEDENAKQTDFELARSAALAIIVSPDHLDELVEFYERLGLYDEIVKIMEQGIGLENAHTGVFTSLAVLYSKYKEEKLMEHCKIYFSRMQIPRVIRACEEGRHWEEATYLYIESEDYDQGIRTMVDHSPICWVHEKFIEIIQKVKNQELYYSAIDFYIREHPMQIDRLLTVLKANLDHARVVHQVEKTDNIPLIMPYLKDVQKENISAVNEAINNNYVEEENYTALRESVDTFDNFDQCGLAGKLEKHELLEFRRIAAYLLKRNQQYERSIDISKKDHMFKEAIDTARCSADSKLVDNLLAHFTEEKDNQCFAATLFTCYDFVKADVALELAFRNGIMDYVMPFMIQYVREMDDKIKELDERTKPEEEEEEEESAMPVNLPGMGIPLALANSAYNDQPQMMGGMGMGGMPGMGGMGMGGGMPGMQPGMGGMPGMQPGMGMGGMQGGMGMGGMPGMQPGMGMGGGAW